MINRKMHNMDAGGETIGRLATRIATILRGKNKPEFEPHIDGGDSVTISNINNVRFTGKKIEQKEYHHHSGYPGGLKTKKIADLKPGEILKKAVREMLPPIKARTAMMKRLIIK